MKEVVTVLLPVYNGKKYIREMLNSVYLQDYRPLELIITDDASTDDTVSVIKKWLSMLNISDNISYKLITNRNNRGLSGNVSDAVKYVHGQYLFLADQDDRWEYDKISRQVEYLEKNTDCVMCICDRSLMNANGRIVCPSVFQYIQADLGKWDYKKVMNSTALYAANCMCLRTDNLKDIFPIPRKIYSHDTFITIMAVHFGKIGFLRNSLTQYRIHGKNLSGQYALETNKNLLKAGYIIFKSFQRNKRIADNDTIILRQELIKRFHENRKKMPMQIWGGKVEYIFFDTIKYMFDNLYKWRRFCE